MIMRPEILAALLVMVVQAQSQQFNTYDASEGPRPLPPLIPGAFPLGVVERPARPPFRPLARRIQQQQPEEPQQVSPVAPSGPPSRPKVYQRRPYQVRGGRISPLEPEPQLQIQQQQQQQQQQPQQQQPQQQQQQPQQLPLIAPSQLPQRPPFSLDSGFHPVTEESNIDEDQGQDQDQGQSFEPTLPPVTVTQRQPPTSPFRIAAAARPQQPPPFRPTNSFAPTPFIQQDEDDDYVPAKTFKQAQPTPNEVVQQAPPQRKSQYRPQSVVRQQQQKAPQYEKPARPQQQSGDRNDIDRASLRERKPVAQILKRYREDNPDGSITWGFENDDGSFKEETIGIDCVTRGKYGYIDPEGNRREYSYVSGIPCNREKEQDEEASDAKGYIDYTNNRYVMPNGDSIDLSSMVKNRARKPVKQYS